MFDVIIIGSGPAGISSSLYLKRFNYSVCIISKNEGSLKKGYYIDNYYGCINVDAYDLKMQGINQAKNLDIDIYNEEVIGINKQKDNTFFVTTNKSSYETKSIFLGIGRSNTKHRIKDENKYEGIGVSYCAICDGFFYKNKTIGLVGEGAYADSEYQVLKRFTNNIIRFKDDEIISLIGEEYLEKVRTKDQDVQLDGLFIANSSYDANALCKHLGILLDNDKNIIVNNYMTNVEGIFAGGDCIKGLKQISIAVAHGTMASLAIKEYLEKIK